MAGSVLGGWGASILKGKSLEMAGQGPGPESIMGLGFEGLGFEGLGF